jgi:WD40 repeat protein/serine/threonine protein kinase
MDPGSSGEFDLLDELAEEFTERYRRGERPSLQEYQERHPELADQIGALFPALAAVEQAEADRAQPGGPTVETAVPPLRQVGDYRILRQIGEGGMGVVYEAEQVSLGRRVALKIMAAQSLGDAKAQERFHREARSAARLHHTNIVPVFEVGQQGDVCYYAMQLIQGQSLDQVVRELRRLRQQSASDRQEPAPATASTRAPAEPASAMVRSLLTGQFGTPTPTASHAAAAPTPDSGRPAAGDGTAAADHARTGLSGMESGHRPYFRSVARIGQQAAHALAHAHARGIVHRDVKPSNLLLDDSGVVWVTDFGLAKTEEDNLTRTGDLPGTLRYMAPERFEGQCDARADIYALGLTLYELLVLKPAFQGSDRLHLLEQIRNREPARPRAVDSRVPRDLETVVLKAGDKDPRRRYPTAEALAEDLRRFLADEPIRARRTSPLERAWRWCRRNPAVAGLMTAVAVALLAGTAVASFFAVRANENAHQAQTNEQTALTEKAEADKARHDTDVARDELKQNLYYAEMNLAGQASSSAGGLARVNELLEHWRPDGDEPERRGWEWYYLSGLGSQSLFTLHRHTHFVESVSWSPDGRRLASGSHDHTIKLWDAATGRQLATLRGHTGLVRAVSWSPDGRRLASAGYGDRTVRVWDADTGRELATLGWHTWNAKAVSWAPDGHRLVSVDSADWIRLWDADTGRLIVQRQAHIPALQTVSWSPDGRRIAAAGDGPPILPWEVGPNRDTTHVSGHTTYIRRLAWTPDGRLLASSSEDGAIFLWELAQDWETGPLPGHTGNVMGLSWSPDGRRLASASSDQTVRLWDRDTQKEVVVLLGHTNQVDDVAWSPDGLRLASAAIDQTVRVWDLGTSPDRFVFRGHKGSVTAVAWSPDGRRLASGGQDRTVRVWDGNTGRQIASLGEHANQVTCLGWAANGRRVASGSQDGTVRLWDAETGKNRAFRAPSSVLGISWNPDGRLLASAGEDNQVTVWDADSEQTVRTIRGLPEYIRALSWSPDGRRLAGGGSDGTVGLWDLDAGGEATMLAGHTAFVSAVRWSPDGKRLASASADQTIIIWNAQTRQQLVTLRGHSNTVFAVSWSPDGRRLVSASGDGTIKVWDAATGRETLSLPGQTGEVRAVDWNRDGLRLASAGADGVVRIWDAAPGFAAQRSPLLLLELDHRLNASPESTQDRLLRAEIRARHGDWDGAAADWTEAARQQGEKAPPWFLAGWWVAGPAAVDDPPPEETTDDVDHTRAAADGSLRWRGVTATADGSVDLAALNLGGAGARWVLLRVYSPREQPAAALLDGACVRFALNGRLLHEVPQPRPADAIEEAVPVTLRAGWNTLLFRVGAGPAADRLGVWLSADGANRARALSDRGRADDAEAVAADALGGRRSRRGCWRRPGFTAATRRTCASKAPRSGLSRRRAGAENAARNC